MMLMWLKTSSGCGDNSQPLCCKYLLPHWSLTPGEWCPDVFWTFFRSL